jgi:hypothetical protein
METPDELMAIYTPPVPIHSTHTTLWYSALGAHTVLYFRFVAKNEHNQNKLLYFVNTGNDKLTKIGHDFRK